MNVAIRARTPWSRVAFGLLPVLVAASVGAADAAAILLNDGRGARAFVDTWVFVGTGTPTDESIDYHEVLPSSPFAPFVASVTATAGSPDSGTQTVTGVAVANQTSNLAPLLFTATGDASVELDADTENDFGTVIGVSTFHVSFQLLTPHSFVLDGFLDAIFPGNFASVSLDGALPGPGPPFFLTIFSFASTNGAQITEDGVLDPGIYRLNAEARGQAGNDRPGFFQGEGRYRFSFALTELTTPVSEPSAVIFLALSIGAAGLRRWRQGHCVQRSKQ